MKNTLLYLLLAGALVTGCAEARRYAGASAENDNNVMTGGPVTGTRLNDLPQSVRQTLQTKAPNAEVADIDKEMKDGREVYRIKFIEPGKNPTLFISTDGRVFEEPMD